ncbi:MAG: PKD domain-containing protein [Anaerolinea sp.]|nr:PKD domain-containing protein [Anaerolinea sp.]
MTKRLFILYTMLVGITGLLWGNVTALERAAAIQTGDAPQAPTVGPDPAIDPNIRLLNAQPVSSDQFLSLQVVVTNVGDTDMTTIGQVGHYLAYTNTFTGAVLFGGMVLPALAAGDSVTLTQAMRGPVVPGSYYAFSRLTYSGDGDLSNNLAGPFTVTVVADDAMDGLFTGRRSDGVLSTQNLALFGPGSCTGMGDPFSPSGSPWAPGLYSYQFQVRIPADYPYDVVRVEVFDPDSINQPGSTFVVQRTQLAVDQGLPLFATLSCPTSNNYHMQYQPCLIPTGELYLGLPLDRINPYWFVRIDENRRPATGVNSGCGAPPGNAYTPAYNTATHYELSYWAQDGDGAMVKMALAAYTGQVGDGVRDNGNHLTDMQWVTPGGQVSLGQMASVPTDCGSPNGGDYDPIACPAGTPVGPGHGFEVSLAQLPDLPVDPLTGERILHLDVTTIGGASENGFDIWAGPNTYVNNVSSDVNIRNLQILNAPGAHNPLGVAVLALNNLPLNSNTNFRVDIPLVEIGPEYAGQTIEISSFDSDSGAAPPLHFYFDSLYFNPATGSGDWGVTYTGNEGGRCSVGNCNDRWVTPPYTLTVPGDLAHCDYDNPDASCIPFFGGRLMASYRAGQSDTYSWQVRLPQPPEPDVTQGCAAFPIAVHEAIRSVNPPGSPINPYPHPSQFEGPPYPPSYEDFLYHRPDMPLAEARTGDVFLLHNGFDPGNFGWLLWNSPNSGSSTTFVNSLTWPGDSNDFTDAGSCGDNCPTPLYPHRVRGYIHPDAPLDLSLHQTDWVLANTGVSNASAVRAALNGHSILSRQLRLLVWDESRTFGSIGAYRVARFAVFRLAGYSLQTGWILLEFVQWDDSCGQFANLLTGGEIAGASRGIIDTAYTFTATVAPPTTTLPVAYQWQATDLPPLAHFGAISDVVTFAWAEAGVKTITVTMHNGRNGITMTHTITIATPTMTAVALSGPTVGQPGMAYTFTAVVAPPTALTPITYTWQTDGQLPITHTNGLTDTVGFAWPSVGTYTVSVTAVNPFNTVTATHAITILPDDLTLTVMTAGGGSVQVEPDLPLYLHGTVVTLTAVSDPGWLFDSWSGDLGGSDNPAFLTMDGHKSVTATFQIDPDSLLTAVLLDGPPTGIVGETITFTAAALPPTALTPITYTWQADGQESIIHTGGLTDTVSFVWPEAWMFTVTVTAANAFNAVTDTHAIAIFSDSLMLTTAVMGGGSVQVEPDLPLYLHGTVVTLTAVPDPGWLFDGWSGDLAGNANPTFLTMNDHKNITATFQIDPASLLTAVLLDGPETGMVGGSFTFTATAVPPTATLPITYTWQTDGQPPIIHTAGLTDTATFAWADWGTYTVSVTAVNAHSAPVTTTIVIHVLPWQLYLPVVNRPG